MNCAVTAAYLCPLRSSGAVVLLSVEGEARADIAYIFVSMVNSAIVEKMFCTSVHVLVRAWLVERWLVELERPATQSRRA